MDYDVIVMGGGLAGLSTANRAAELGLRPVVLEQGADARYPCNSRFAGGLVHVALRDLTADADDIHQTVLRNTGGHTDAALTRLLADNAGRAGEWLRGQGAKFIKAGPYEWQRWVLAPPRPRTPGLNWDGRGPDVLLRTLTANLATRQGLLLRNARGAELIVEDGRVAGLVATQDGGTVCLTAPAVVIADGGFQGDADLVREFITPKPEALFQRGAGTGRGDGLRMARAAGAALTGMDRFYGHLLGREVFQNEKLWPYPILDHLAAAGVLVDENAERFCDETGGGVFMANETAKLANPAGIVVVFDEAIWTTVGADQRFPPTPNDSFVRVGGTVHAANDLRDLAGMAGLPADALCATVEAHNTAIESGAMDGKVPLRGKAGGGMTPIATPPFRAVQACAGITYTMGGIAIDTHARALDESGAPIPGLYAAGSSTGGAEGGPLAGYIGGLSKAVITGLRAAEHIAGERLV